MRLGGYRTEVRRGLTWGVATDAAARVSVMRLIFFFFVFGFTPAHAEPGRFAPIRAESDRIGQISVCFDTR